MNNYNETTKIKKRLARTLAIWTAILFSAYCFILAPLYTYMSSDIIFAVTVIPEILDFIMGVVDVVAYAICFSIITYSIFKLSFKASGSIMAVFCAAVFLKYSANLIVTLITDKTISYNDIASVLLFFSLDVILMFIIASISNSIIKKYYEKRSIIAKASAQLGTPCENSTDTFLFKKTFSKDNPLQLSALIFSAIMSLVKISTRIIYDLFIGLPDSLPETMWMITYYLSDLLIIVIMYVVALFVFMCQNELDRQKGTEDI